MRILAAIGVLAIVVAIAAAIFFFGGFFNVAASEPEPDIVKWALVKVRMAAVERHAVPVPGSVKLDDPQTVQAGARAYAAHGCANCHGAPGVMWQKFSEGLNPDPPDLKEVVAHREPGQLFWVVKNGIKMTGMPSFAAIGVEDKDIWAIVAFLKKLPNVSDADFKAWSGSQ
jgi:mono/diheme cytochrome c family protein